MAAFAARREKSGLTSIPIKASEQGCRLGKVERGNQGAKGCKVTQFHRDPSIERGDDEHQFYSLDTIILAPYNTWPNPNIHATNLRSMTVGIRPRRKTTTSPLYRIST